MKEICIYKEDNLESEICPICHENLDTEQIYEIPECKHKFHTNCIITWFRVGNSNCPYCNSNNNHESSKSKYQIISNYCRRNNANTKIKKEVESIKKLKKDITEINKNIKEIENKSGIFKEIKKEISNLRAKQYKKYHNMYVRKRKLLNNVVIVPFILKDN